MTLKKNLQGSCTFLDYIINQFNFVEGSTTEATFVVRQMHEKFRAKGIDFGIVELDKLLTEFPER